MYRSVNINHNGAGGGVGVLPLLLTHDDATGSTQQGENQ